MGHTESEPDIVGSFAEQVNLHHPTMKLTAEIPDNETIFLETVVYQRTTFSEKWEKSYPWRKDAVLTETFLYIHFHLLSATNC